MLIQKLTEDNLAIISANVEAADGINMIPITFLLDTGATSVAMSENILTKMLGYDAETLNKIKIPMPKDEGVRTAAGVKTHYYYIPAPRMSLDGNEFKLQRILVNEMPNNNSLFGMAALRLFHVLFNFEETPKYKNGRVVLEFRNSARTEFTNLSEPFAHETTEQPSNLLKYIRSVGGIRIKSLSPTEQYWMSCSDFRVDINELNALVKAGKVVVRDGCYIPV